MMTRDESVAYVLWDLTMEFKRGWRVLNRAVRVEGRNRGGVSAEGDIILLAHLFPFRCGACDLPSMWSYNQVKMPFCIGGV
jgi:hypothetical protein